MTTDHVIGRCYCGACSISARTDALTVAYCHCADCKRWTGAPSPVFAAFNVADVMITPTVAPTQYENGVARTNCPTCGSPLHATFPYLPEQAYVPVGVLNDAARFAPQIHCHADAQLPWLHRDDVLPREGASARDKLNKTRDV